MTAAGTASYISRIAVEEEATKGTAGTTPDLYLYCSDDPGLNPVQTIIKSEVVQDRDLKCLTPGSYHIEGSIPLYVTAENIGWFLKWALGSVSSAQQGGTAAYQHDFTPADDLKAFTTWLKRGDNQTIKTTYCVINELEFTQAVGEALRATVNIIGKSDIIAADYGTESFDTLCSFADQHFTASIGGSTSGQAAQVHDMSLKIANGFDVDSGRVLGSRFFTDLVTGKRVVNGSFNMFFSDDLEMQMFWGNSTATSPADALTGQALIFTYDLGIEADTGYNYELEFTIPDAYYETTTVNVGGKRVSQNVTFLGIYDTVATNAISIKLVNKTTDYVI